MKYLYKQHCEKAKVEGFKSLTWSQFCSFALDAKALIIHAGRDLV
jgi:hypothetical protein